VPAAAMADGNSCDVKYVLRGRPKKDKRPPRALPETFLRRVRMGERGQTRRAGCR